MFEFRPAARIGPAFLSRLFIVLMDAMINGLSLDLRGDGLTRKRVCVCVCVKTSDIFLHHNTECAQVTS